jgi:hypothetical protein
MESDAGGCGICNSSQIEKFPFLECGTGEPSVFILTEYNQSFPHVQIITNYVCTSTSPLCSVENA